MKFFYLGNNFSKNSVAYPVLLMIPVTKMPKDFLKLIDNYDEEDDNIMHFVPDKDRKKSEQLMDIEGEDSLYESLLRDDYFLCFFKVLINKSVKN